MLHPWLQVLSPGTKEFCVCVHFTYSSYHLLGVQVLVYQLYFRIFLTIFLVVKYQASYKFKPRL